MQFEDTVMVPMRDGVRIGMSIYSPDGPSERRPAILMRSLNRRRYANSLTIVEELVEAGYVSLRKAATDGRQRTWARLTPSGRTAFGRHVKALEALAAAVASEPTERQTAVVKNARRTA